MKQLVRFSIAVLVGLAACMQVFPAWAVGRVEARRLTPISTADLAAMPNGELQVGDRTLSLERVRNGFVARDLASGEAVVITDELLQGFMVSMPLASSDRRQVTLVRQEVLGAAGALSIEIEEATGVSFAGTVVHGQTRLPIAFRPAEPMELDGFTEPGQLRRSHDEVVIIVVLSAAGILAAAGAIGCTIAILWTNCIDDCGEACGSNGMESASEGWCGECTCECHPPLVTD